MYDIHFVCTYSLMKNMNTFELIELYSKVLCDSGKKECAFALCNAFNKSNLKPIAISETRQSIEQPYKSQNIRK